MHRYNIKEKFWSWGTDFQILDEAGRPIFLVNGQAFLWGSQLSFQDTEGTQLAFIEQRRWSFKPKYEIHRADGLFAEVVKEFSWFKKNFTLDVPGPNDYSIAGSFWDHDYVFSRGGRAVAHVSRPTWSWSHCYGVEIINGEDVVNILCTAIVIDQVLHDEED